MVRNKLADLNNHLFAQLERLNDEEITGDKLKEEIERSKAMSGIATQIVASGNLAIKAHETLGYELKKGTLPLLEGDVHGSA